MKQSTQIQQKLISAYTKAPILLARRLADIFAVYETPDMIAIHNEVIDEIVAITDCPTEKWEDLLNDIAKVILHKGENTLGKTENDQKTGIDG